MCCKKVLITELNKIKCSNKIVLTVIIDTYNLKSNIVDIIMTHQTNTVLDAVAENATNNKDKFDNIDKQRYQDIL